MGNPGEEYKLTRHNIGFLVIDSILSIVQSSKLKAQGKLRAEIGEIRRIGGIREKIILVKPLTFMNKSGESVRKVVEYYLKPGDLTPGDLLRKTPGVWGGSLFVVHDELDLPLGKLRIQKNISAAGHHGVKSIIEHLGMQDFVRFRLGVQAPYCDITTAKKAKNYLLSNFTKEEMEVMEPTIERTAEAVLYAVEQGVEQAMGKYNG